MDVPLTPSIAPTRPSHMRTLSFCEFHDKEERFEHDVSPTLYHMQLLVAGSSTVLARARAGTRAS